MRSALCLVHAVCGCATLAAQPHQATGFKVGDVTATTAVVWTRLTQEPRPNPFDRPRVRIRKSDGRVKSIDYPYGVTVAGIRFAAPGCDGEVRVRYRREGAGAWLETGWSAVDSKRDFARQFRLRELEPGTRYRLRVEARAKRGGRRTSRVDGRFKTAPKRSVEAGVMFTVSTCQEFKDRDGSHGFDIYSAMLELAPDFFVQAGDAVYYGDLAKNVELARYHWQRMYGLPSNVAFHRRVGSYFMRDDRDTWRADCWPGRRDASMHEFAFEDGLAVYLEQTPIEGDTMRSRRWGRDLEVWFVEGRAHRSPNSAVDGPEKSLWGAAQLAWFERTFAESDATFRVLCSPTPIVGPEREGKDDSHASVGFAHEGRRIRAFLGKQKNAVVLCGDQHWQYMSIDPEFGVREYSCGPASDAHAGGWRADDVRASHHRYLRVAGGFLSVEASRAGGAPTLALRFHDTVGEVRFEDRVVAR